MATQSQLLYSDIPFRVRVGVAGARNLHDAHAIAVKIKEVLEQKIFTLYDENSLQRISKTKRTTISFSVLTTLGGDAERAVAREVLKGEHGSIDVILPCSKTAFMREFVSGEAQHEFEELFKKSRRPIALHKRFVSSQLSESVQTTRLKEMLIEAEQHIVDRCDVLIAVRDKESNGDANTAEIIEYATKKKRPVISISTQTLHEISIESGHGLNASTITGLDVFNSFGIREQEQDARIKKEYEYLFVSSGEGKEKILKGEGVNEHAKQIVREHLLPFYVRADTMADDNQKKYQRAGLLVYSFSATAVAAVALGTLVHKLSPWAFGFELLLLMTILITVLLADRNRTHRKWIESRFLAERLRAAQFLAACGVEATPIRVPPHLGAMGQADDWTLMAFNEVWQRLPAMKGCDKETFSQLKKIVSRQWLDDQINYHNRNTKKSKHRNQLLEWGGVLVFSFALLAAALHLIFFILHQEWFEAPLTFAAIVLPAVGAAIGGIRTHREYSRLAKRSENMVQSLTEMKDNLERAESTDEFETLLREIEQVMLIETQDWLMLMRFAKLEAAA